MLYRTTTKNAKTAVDEIVEKNSFLGKESFFTNRTNKINPVITHKRKKISATMLCLLKVKATPPLTFTIESSAVKNTPAPTRAITFMINNTFVLVFINLISPMREYLFLFYTFLQAATPSSMPLILTVSI